MAEAMIRMTPGVEVLLHLLLKLLRFLNAFLSVQANLDIQYTVGLSLSTPNVYYRYVKG